MTHHIPQKEPMTFATPKATDTHPTGGLSAQLLSTSIPMFADTNEMITLVIMENLHLLQLSLDVFPLPHSNH